MIRPEQKEEKKFLSFLFSSGGDESGDDEDLHNGWLG